MGTFAKLYYINDYSSVYLFSCFCLFMAGAGVSPRLFGVNGQGIISILIQGTSVIEVIRS